MTEVIRLLLRAAIKLCMDNLIVTIIFIGMLLWIMFADKYSHFSNER